LNRKGLVMMEQPTKGCVFLVEDDETTRNINSAILISAGFETSIAGTIAELRERIIHKKFDVLLLDLWLPDGNALDLIEDIRKSTSAGIIIATRSSDLEVRLNGLEKGADEYLEKPVHPRELLARVRNLILRVQEREQNVQSTTIYHFEGWHLDLHSRKVQFDDGQEAALTENEFRLLGALVRYADQPMHRDRLLAILNDSDDTTTRAIDKAIYRLRIKLHAILGTRAPLIQTVHGFGYRFIAKRL